MYNVYSYDYDLLKVVRTKEEAEELINAVGPVPGGHNCSRGEHPYADERREARLRHPMELILECNPDLPVGLSQLPKVVDLLDDQDDFIFGDDDIIRIEHDGSNITSVIHEYPDGGAGLCVYRYRLLGGELV